MTAQGDPIAELDPVLRQLAREVMGYESEVADLPVTPKVSPIEIRERLARFDFAAPCHSIS